MPLKKWWTEGEDGAVAVYRARLMIPLIILTALVLTQYASFSGSGAREHLSFFFGCWIVCAAGLLIRHKRAAIFTKDTFILDRCLDNCSASHSPESNGPIGLTGGQAKGTEFRFALNCL
jgi:hypothetical protein